MAETTMPAAEADVVAHDDERNSYEFAFHVLPTVAEGEVASVFEELKAHIAKVDGEFLSEEAPERIDLVYDITKSIDGKNRKFASAYFGWVRFKLGAEKIEGLVEEIDSHAQLLRYFILKLTKLEEENPFRFHENRKSVKMVEVVDEEAAVIPGTTKKTEEADVAAPVSEKELDESLDKLTTDEGKTEEVAEEKTEKKVEEVTEEKKN